MWGYLEFENQPFLDSSPEFVGKWSNFLKLEPFGRLSSAERTMGMPRGFDLVELRFP